MLRTVLLVAIIGSGGKGGASHWVKRKKLEPRNLDPHDPRPHTAGSKAALLPGRSRMKQSRTGQFATEGTKTTRTKKPAVWLTQWGFAGLIGEANEAKHYGF